MRVNRGMLLGVMFFLLALARPGGAEIGTIDNVPAATLLLPYFEVDLGDPNGITTLFSINNAAADAALAHVVLWTDESVETLDFDVYLTGYDVQTINVRDFFAGRLPRTADAGTDPADTISPRGALSLDVDLPGATGPCSRPYTDLTLNTAFLDHLRKAHTGRFSPLLGGCAGASHEDDIARGYITVDVVKACTLLSPDSPGYFTTIADFRNVLWGDYFYFIPGSGPGEDSAMGEPLVHIEACPNPSVGTGALCPFAPGELTYYGRYSGGADQREPLADVFAARFVEGGPFAGSTDLIVWRDTGAAGGAHPCGAAPPWFPLGQDAVIAFDEEENSAMLCSGDNVSPPIGTGACFPLETQRIHLSGGNGIGNDPVPPFTFGWIDLDLDFPGDVLAQAWVTVVTFGGTVGQAKAPGAQYSVINSAQKIKCACPKR